MTQLEFFSGMKKLSSFYFKELTNDQMISWYDMFKEISGDVFDKAIMKIAKESNFIPSAGSLYEECSGLNKNYLCELAKFMYKDGYFHKGAKKLSDEHAHRNFDKTMMWLNKGIIPSFLKSDMEEYMNDFKQSQLARGEVLKIEC